jgi:phosphoglycolate phosphatase-like HAD superfamily hydrolase
LVQQAVIDSPWVPGIREYLKEKHTNQYFVLITATPQEEIEQILHALDITRCFREVYGAPTDKATVVVNVLKHLHCAPEQALVVGDSETDLSAAEMNKVAFLLRRTPFNQDLQERFKGSSFVDLSD